MATGFMAQRDVDLRNEAEEIQDLTVGSILDMLESLQATFHPESGEFRVLQVLRGEIQDEFPAPDYGADG